MLFVYIIIAGVILVICVMIGLHADTFIEWIKAFFIGIVILLAIALIIGGIIVLLRIFKPDLFG